MHVISPAQVCLVFFGMHMMVEGYVFAAGSPLCALLWLSIGAASAWQNKISLTLHAYEIPLLAKYDQHPSNSSSQCFGQQTPGNAGRPRAFEEERTDSGWKIPDMGNVHLELSPDEQRIHQLILSNETAIHVFSGIDAYPMVFEHSNNASS